MPVAVRSAEQWRDFAANHIARGLGRLHNDVIVRGEGMYLYSGEGKQYLDFTAGIGVTNLGHCHPAVTAAAAAQVGTITHMQSSIMLSVPYLQLVERLLPVMPDPSLDCFFFWNSGTEAVEAAIKLARRATGRNNIISFQGAYHGRTAGSGALTRSKPIYTQFTGPLMPGVYATAFPYWHSLGVPPSTSEKEIVRLACHALDMLIRQQVNAKDIAAIFIEPVQGEGGYVPCPPDFLRHLRKVCDEHGIMLVIDEVQTGFFRTGEYFALDHLQPEPVRPDIMIFAKGVANGFPLSGIVSSKRMMDTFDLGGLGGTYGGNPIACAAGVAVQDVLATGEVKVNVKARSDQLFSGLRALQVNPKTSHLIAQVRGVGLMAAVEFRSATDRLTHEGLPEGTTIPDKIGTRVRDICYEQGLVILTTSCFDTIRFIPALIVSEEQMARAVQIFSDAVMRVALEG